MGGRDHFKDVVGKSMRDATRRRSVDQIIVDTFESIHSKYPLRDLGFSENGVVHLTEEAREYNIHTLGSPGGGKSKLLELLLRGDIDRLLKDPKAPGACLLDPSDGGSTVLRVLKYCIAKEFKKVVLIDPYDIVEYDAVASINPLSKPLKFAKSVIMDSIQILWGSTFKETPRITKYIPALIECLHSTGFTLYEAIYFMADDKKGQYERIRDKIMDKRETGSDGKDHLCFHPLNLNRKHLEGAFKNTYTYEAFQSTVNRLNPLFEDTMQLVFGSAKALDFDRLISDGYLLLVTLDSSGWGREQQQLLGTFIINEIINAKEKLARAGQTIPYYLYIDEVGQYPTPKLTEILDLKRKLNLRLCVAHQRWDQIKDRDLASALYGGSAQIHALFHTANPDDRLKMVRLMYGGDLPDRDVSFHLKDMAKQNAVIKIGKTSPQMTRLEDIPDVEVTPEQIKDFKLKLYAQDFYRSPKEIRAEIKNRFVIPTHSATTPIRPSRNLKSPSTRKPTSAAGKPKATSGKQNVEPSQHEDKGSTSGSSVFDDIAHSADVLQQKKGRPKRKGDTPPTQAE